jgi:peroxiredoxin
MQRLRAWKYWPWLREAGIVVLMLLAVRAYQQRSLVSGLAPQLSGIDLAGKPVSLADYRGKPLVLHFWATWCNVCRAEQHNLDALARDTAVLSIATDSGSAQRVASYAAEHKIALRVIPDPDGELSKRFGVHSFPTTFLLDRDGAIRHSEVGYTTELGLRLRVWSAGR